MKILLVEDDFMQEEAIKEAIMDAFPGTGIEVIWTERMFREQIESILQSLRNNHRTSRSFSTQFWNAKTSTFPRTCVIYRREKIPVN